MDTKQLKEIFSIFEQSQVSKMDLELDGMTIKLEKSEMPSAPVTVHPETPVTETTSLETLDAPLVGVFWQASKPGEDPYVKVGDTVDEGDVICIIEAMKTMNEIRAEKSGTIQEVLVEDGALIEFGQPLMTIGD